METLEQHKSEGYRILADHGINGWTITLDNAKSRLGVCNYRYKRISLSRSFVAHASSAEIRDTVLHEVAHAIAGASAGHGYKWQRIARAIGCNATRCGENPAGRPVGRYTAHCATHGVIGYRWRLTDKMIHGVVCGRCRGEITWTDHGTAGYVKPA